MQNNITCVTVNYNTAQLVDTAIRTLRKFYGIQVVLIDNASSIDSFETYVKLRKDFADLIVVCNSNNIGHGPALHQGILLANTPYVFTLDSDTEICKGGFLEKMLLQFRENENLYAMGWKRYVNCNGIPGNYEHNKNLIPYIHPYAMLLDKAKYMDLPKFEHRGAPCAKNMQQANLQGFDLVEFEIESYVKHLIAGTRRLFNGNWKGQQPLSKWTKEAKYRI